MKRILTLLFGLFVATWVHAVTVYHQPTPYPLKKSDGTTMPQDLNKIHIHDGWMNNYYPSIMTLQREDKLKLGGWGDFYRGYLNFDLTGLPKDPTNVALWLRFYPSGSTATPFRFCIPSSTWNIAVTWGMQPTFLGCTGYFATPSTDSWAGWWITSWYQNWQNGVWGKYGIMLDPQYNNNNFDVIRSSRYADYTNDPYADGKRPLLQFDFTPTLELKMPLSGNLSWLVTTEVGGYDCKGSYDQYHDSTNWFSIDFSWRTKNLYYTNPDPIGNRQNNGVYIPVRAAAGGKVLAGVNYYNNSDPNHPNGYFVSVDHDGDGNPSTGVQTRYLHLQPPGPVVAPGHTVAQGALLGYMGNSGLSSGAHLHFGIRYNDNGASTVPELTKVVMEGKLLKSYQTECSVSGSGVPTDWIRYYPSTNTP
jgi:hypothetical protein